MKAKKSSSIQVISIQVTPQKPNTAINEENKIISHMKSLLALESILGISRVYLYSSRRIIQWIHFIQSATMIFFTIYFGLLNRVNSASYNVVRDTNHIEYVLLIIFSILTQRSTFKKLFEDLSTFDVYLNITEHLSVTSPIARVWLWIIASTIYSAGECFIIIIYVPRMQDYAFFWTYITLMGHDYEHLFFCSLLRMIMNRVFILKAYVVKTFSVQGKRTEKKLNEVEALSNKARLDIVSLHRNYELLHKCAEQLNSIMNLPLMIMLFCSGLSTTMLAKSLFKALQSTDDPLRTRATMIFCVSRCLKYTALVIIPCYLSSVTTTQVSHIRTILHDAMNTAQIDKVERRRVKAFFQLTRENEFAYALWGVIRLNMSLPLSYLSLCTTYLVIIIQFSKFID